MGSVQAQGSEAVQTGAPVGPAEDGDASSVRRFGEEDHGAGRLHHPDLAGTEEAFGSHPLGEGARDVTPIASEACCRRWAMVWISECESWDRRWLVPATGVPSTSASDAGSGVLGSCRHPGQSIS